MLLSADLWKCLYLIINCARVFPWSPEWKIKKKPLTSSIDCTNNQSSLLKTISSIQSQSFIKLILSLPLCFLIESLPHHPFSLISKQEVLLHHSSKGPRVSIPQRVAACAARRDVENLAAHVRRTHPDARGAALLLRGLRLVGLHPAAVHGLSLQPGQQQTGTERGEKSIKKKKAVPRAAITKGNKSRTLWAWKGAMGGLQGCHMVVALWAVRLVQSERQDARLSLLLKTFYCKHIKDQLISVLMLPLITAT